MQALQTVLDEGVQADAWYVLPAVQVAQDAQTMSANAVQALV